ncbi:hypothetical protein AVEN_90644-1 [Araneus ventricosus]|uniref:Uncharacterized protein n=1 Tax=Araneus ventricosus TaxID=182803 RepID=A0A4Y2RN53_ARAVE|nr:hypothetical protein AVEN_90644-1 [Araneus ventricosus]
MFIRTCLNLNPSQYSCRIRIVWTLMDSLCGPVTWSPRSPEFSPLDFFPWIPLCEKILPYNLWPELPLMLLRAAKSLEYLIMFGDPYSADAIHSLLPM